MPPNVKVDGAAGCQVDDAVLLAFIEKLHFKGNPNPEDPVPLVEHGPFRRSPKNAELVSQGEVFGRKFSPATQDPTNEQHNDANQAHFTASKSLDNGLETMASP